MAGPAGLVSGGGAAKEREYSLLELVKETAAFEHGEAKDATFAGKFETMLRVEEQAEHQNSYGGGGGGGGGGSGGGSGVRRVHRRPEIIDRLRAANAEKDKAKKAKGGGHKTSRWKPGG